MVTLMRVAPYPRMGGLFAGILVFASCRGGPGPGDVAAQYLGAVTSGKLADAYQYVSSEDKAVKTLADYIHDGAFAAAIGRTIANKVSVAIVGVVERGDTATAIVRTTAPDLMATVGDVFSAGLAAAFSGDTAKMQQQIADAVRQKYTAGSLPMTSTTDTLELVRERAGWRVVGHWRAEALQTRADSLRKFGRLREALSAYDSAVALAPHLSTAKERSEEVRGAIALEGAKQVYTRQYLTLERFRVSAGSLLGPEILGTVRNRGDSVLTRVEVTVFFLDRDGNPIGEKAFNPVFVSEFSFSDDGPMKPGYVRDFGYFVERDAPSGWARRARAEITRIEFQSKQPKN